MQTKDYSPEVVNGLLRKAQTAMWDLEDVVLSRSEILKVTGMLQSKKVGIE